MVVQHNIKAMNSNRMLGLTTNAQAKSTERLSSGYKINRAADDAAGLAISEKMRRQIRGLTQASANAQDGISAVQTAEGALTEVQDMLQRMNELSVKAANGTMSASDRKAVQDEIDQLVTEIDRVAETTKFNETYLLKGDRSVAKGYSYSYGAVAESITATAEMDSDAATGLTAKITFTEGAKASDQNALAKAFRDQGITVSSEKDADGNEKFGITLNGKAATNYKVNSINGSKFEIVDLQGNQIATVTAEMKAADAADDKADRAAITAGTQLYDKDGKEIADADALAAILDADKDAKIYTDAPVKGESTAAYTGIDITGVTGAKPGDTYTYVAGGDTLPSGGTANAGAAGWYDMNDTGDNKLTITVTGGTAASGDTITVAFDAAAATEAVKDTDYTYEAAGGNTAASTASKKSAVITASAITAAQNAGDVARYYDKDGNAISNNALGNYFSVLSTFSKIDAADGIGNAGGTDRATITAGTQLFDKDGKEIADAAALAALLDADKDAKIYTDAPVKGESTAAYTGIDITGVTGAKPGDTYTYVAGGDTLPSGGTATGGQAGWYDMTDTSDTALTITVTGAAAASGDTITVAFDAANATEAVKDTDYTYEAAADDNKSAGTVAALAGTQLYDAVGNVIDMDDAAEAVAANQNQTGVLSLNLHVGADATRDNQINLNIEAMSAKGLGINGLRVDGLNDSNALDAVETIKAALQKVSTQRSTLGAVQNRLEHTINNLDNVVENTTSAEAQIRDTDIATEMVKYANNNILQQAGTSMLSQANQSNQLALSLLG